ncbi:type II toxin-antitoxin system PemK/MazF family toxin [Herbiconiux sp. CPCC 205763]|uniref:mRNA interferase n=1 Tax=Herbiconiux aconitum TaxID=2970913 RepID=A0ABT2GVC0_9MICO|nr:type II toxin-antitoxin system PemK/MazF family toxin [Herbiconiux aconitum]MCS5720157.1 type II toxin-antitoxin system PemK/MazF family toxin [Herbiconiux aconitum]
MVINRGSIWWTDLGERRGSAPARRRPVLVMQADRFNRSEISTCVVLTITSKTALAEQPGNVFLPSTASGLRSDSVVNVTQISTVDIENLRDQVGELPSYLLEGVERGMRLVLAL